MHRVQRRDFLLAAGALIITPLAAEAQPARIDLTLPQSLLLRVDEVIQ